MSTAGQPALTMSEHKLPAQQTACGASPDAIGQLSLIVRQLHDTLTELGVMPDLQHAANGLPEARRRLSYIADKSADAANKVLNAVDMAKSEHQRIARETRSISAAIAENPLKAVASGAVASFEAAVLAATRRSDQQLTDIMLAQDFHDLTGQVMAKVVALAGDLEDSLMKLQMQYPPLERACKSARAAFDGPVVDQQGRTDVVADQREVDELLASLGI